MPSTITAPQSFAASASVAQTPASLARAYTASLKRSLPLFGCSCSSTTSVAEICSSLVPPVAPFACGLSAPISRSPTLLATNQQVTPLRLEVSQPSSSSTSGRPFTRLHGTALHGCSTLKCSIKTRELWARPTPLPTTGSGISLSLGSPNRCLMLGATAFTFSLLPS